MSWRGIAETVSGSPRANATPAHVVARALNPRCWRERAVPTSQGFGRTKHPDSCRERNAAMADRWVEGAAGIGTGLITFEHASRGQRSRDPLLCFRVE